MNRYHNKIVLLHCVSGYPTPENEANLKRISTLKNNFKKINIGLSDHTSGIITSIASIPYNTVFIEKHFILSKKLYGTYNVGSGKSVPIYKVIDYFAKNFSKKIKYLDKYSKLKSKNLVPDITKLKKKGFKSKYSFNDILNDFM